MSALDSRPKPPKTPLRRVPPNVLRAQALSGSHPSRQNPNVESQEETIAQESLGLESLGPLFSDLAEAVSDLHMNLTNLDLVCQDLDGFNQAFSTYLYGLRMSHYTTGFDEAPDHESFEFARERRKKAQQEEEEERRRVKEDEKVKLAEALERSQEASRFELADRSIASTSSSHQRGIPRPTSSITTNLHGTSKPHTQSKSLKNFTNSTRAQQRQLIRSTEPILSTLPLKFREKQPSRQEMEKVICLLLIYPNGLGLKQIIKLEPTLALHRARECCTALVAAKQATKFNKDST
ncbi:hypothetical protein CROQUDRAFT_132278 [Cronartium quercuum f. sp. fusiforme G11]|uniref:DASH complex subunit DAM1 n=1 Tax=Cronartium quercuum f. sp. fusiforme G11 TaxID=708437 RepID=A0A9P6NPD7_9BASI|nr:hypothetical protein CROQUDRAFT_132278 [Cronartium quercuum f. sp. fusiforme G11]